MLETGYESSLRGLTSFYEENFDFVVEYDWEKFAKKKPSKHESNEKGQTQDFDLVRTKTDDIENESNFKHVEIT